MRRATLLLLLVWHAVAICSPAHAISKDVVDQTKNAVSYIEVSDGSGTAFQIDPAGYFITNQHVVEDYTTVKMVLNSGEPNQETVTGHVVRVDKDLDFALIKADKPASATLTFGSDNDLYETLPVTAFGFPLGKDILLGLDGSPTVSVNIGHVSALRRDSNGLEMIQLDADVNPGNSGGPLVDDQGHVVGVVEAQIEDTTGINLAIPVGILKQFLAKPDISLVPDSVPEGRQSDQTTFTVTVTSFESTYKPSSVTVTFQNGSGSKRSFTAEPSGGTTYTFSAVPVLGTNAPEQLQLTLVGPSGKIGATTTDTSIEIGGKRHLMSEFTVIYPSGSLPSKLAAGGSVFGRVSGLPTVSAVISGISAEINLGNVSQINVSPADANADSVDYEINVEAPEFDTVKTDGELGLGSNGGAPGTSSNTRPISSTVVSSNDGSAIPIDVTGYNVNVITGKNDRTNVVSFDRGTDSWFESGAVDDSGNEHDDGLPAGALVSSTSNTVAGGHTVFWIQPSDRPNALNLYDPDANTGQFNLRRPRRYSSLAILSCGYSVNSNSTGELTINFVDGSQSDPIPYNAFDWVTGQSDIAVGQVGHNASFGTDGMGFSYTRFYPVNIYETDINLQKLGLSDRAIRSITFQGVPQAELPHHPSTTIFAISGVPE